VKIITNAGKHFLTNVDVFQTPCELCTEYFCSSCKFEIAARSCSSQQNSDPNSYCKIYFRLSRVV